MSGSHKTWTTIHELRWLKKLGTYRVNTENTDPMPRKELLRNYIKFVEKGTLVRDSSGIVRAKREDWGDIDIHKVLKEAKKMLKEEIRIS